MPAQLLVLMFSLLLMTLARLRLHI